MKKHPFLRLILLLFAMSFFAPVSHALERKEIADYLGVDPNLIFVECRDKTISLTEDNNLKFCLKKENHEKRCEISVNTFSKAPWFNDVSYSFRLTEDALKEQYHYALMQIHVFPDKKLGEEWRCPPITMDMTADHLSIHNRWDQEKLSKTYGYNCAEPGSSIKTRSLFSQDGIATDTWYPVSLSSRFSYKDDGILNLKFGDQPAEEFTGPNSYNDDRIPFLKLGIYKPTTWVGDQKQICIEYKDININLHK